MAVSHVVSGGVQGNSGSIPLGYAIGDLIVVIAFRDDGTEPGIGAGFEHIRQGGFANFNWRVGYMYATATTGLVTGNWNGSCRLAIHVYRDAAPNVDNLIGSGAVDGSVIYEALTCAAATSWVLAWVGTANNDNTNLSATPPNGMILRTNGTGSGSDRRIVSFDTDGPVSSFGGSTRSKGGTNGAWRALVLEITEQGPFGTLNFTETNDTVSSGLSADSLATLD